MSIIDDTIDSAEVATQLDLEGVDVVLDPQQPARQTQVGELSKIIDVDCSMPLSMFQSMTKRELWDGYVSILVRRVVKIARLYSTRLGRVFDFRSFALPANNVNRRTTSIERNGVFIGIMARRYDNNDGNGNTTPTVSIQVRAEIALLEGEDPDYVEPVVEPKLSAWEMFKGWNQ